MRGVDLCELLAPALLDLGPLLSAFGPQCDPGSELRVLLIKIRGEIEVVGGQVRMSMSIFGSGWGRGVSMPCILHAVGSRRGCLGQTSTSNGSTSSSPDALTDLRVVCAEDGLGASARSGGRWCTCSEDSVDKDSSGPGAVAGFGLRAVFGCAVDLCQDVSKRVRPLLVMARMCCLNGDVGRRGVERDPRSVVLVLNVRGRAYWALGAEGLGTGLRSLVDLSDQPGGVGHAVGGRRFGKCLNCDWCDYRIPLIRGLVPTRLQGVRSCFGHLPSPRSRSMIL